MNNEWTWSETNDGWYCTELGLQMAEIEAEKGTYRVWCDGKFKRFSFRPTPMQAEAVFKFKPNSSTALLREAQVRRMEAWYGRRSLVDQLRDLGWSSNNDKYFEADGIRLIKLNRMLKFRLYDGTKTCFVSFTLSPKEARRALNYATKPNQTVFLHSIQKNHSAKGWTEVGNHWETDELAVKRWKDGLYLVWPKEFVNAPVFTWSWARLGFFPTPLEATAAVQLSPTKGKEMAPLYSRDQLQRFLDKPQEEQDKQVKAANDHVAFLKGDVVYACAECGEEIFNDDSYASDAEGNRYHSECWKKHQETTCPECNKEVSCMEQSTEVGPSTYHKNCWRKKAKTTPNFNSASNARIYPMWSEHRAYGVQVYDTIHKWKLRDVNAWGVRSTTSKADYAWVILDFDPTVEEARFCLLLSPDRGEKRYTGSAITRELYETLWRSHVAAQGLRDRGIQLDPHVMRRLEDKVHGGEDFDAFMKRRLLDKVEKEPKVTFVEGDVVDILEDIHFKDVLARGRVCAGGEKEGWDKKRRVDVYIPEINEVRTPTKMRLRKVSKEEL